MKAVRTFKPLDLAVALGGIALAAAIRYSLLNFKSVDFLVYTHGWYNTIKSGGFSSFRSSFSNYNLPYLYLLYAIARFLPNVPALIATKLPSLAADFVTAWFASRIVRLKYQKTLFPFLAGLGVLLSPTVILNSAFWGQADALYTAALVACLYFLLVKKYRPAMILFGLSVSFKAQAIFLAPLLFALFLRREIPWRSVLWVPLVMIAALVPAWIAGRPLLDLLMIYPSQAGQYEQLSMHAPTLFSWVPNSGEFYAYFYPAGLIVGAAGGLLLSIYILRMKGELTASDMVELALFSAVWMPFLLPKMHERYFYPADVLSIVFVFFYPALFYIPVLMNVISFFAYQPTLFGVEPLPIAVLALGILAILVVLTRDAASRLRSAAGPPEAVQ